MTRFLLRRLALLGATLLVASLLIFLMTSVMPGDVGRIVLGPSPAMPPSPSSTASSAWTGRRRCATWSGWAAYSPATGAAL
ncbi:MAG: hypothetical protein U5L11_14040 [Arhodomonas sp.]|nr:hypothetical protein [Arhodomonas sp.]